MRSLSLIPAIAVGIGLGCPVLAQMPGSAGAPDTSHAVAPLTQPGYANASTGLGTNSKNSSGVTASPTPEEGTTYEEDDSLYRGKTSESGEVPMMRDEGRLHFKTHPKEKIQQVDSLKSLQSNAADHTFDGSLLHNSVTSIQDVAVKSNADQQTVKDVDDRFKARQLTFSREGNEPQKAQSESTPSPTPSATASPQKKDSSKAHQ